MHGICSWKDWPAWKMKAGSFNFNKPKVSADGKFTIPDPQNHARYAYMYRPDGTIYGARYNDGKSEPSTTVVLAKVK